MASSETERGLFAIVRGPLAAGSTVAAEPDEAVVFMQDGRPVGSLGPGRHVLDPRALPFLAGAMRSDPHGLPVVAVDALVVRMQGGAVATTGLVGPVVDQQTKLRLQVQARVRVPLRVADVGRAGFGLFTMGEPASANQWLGDMALMAIREQLRADPSPRNVAGFGFGEGSDAAAAAVRATLESGLADYGLAVADAPSVELELPPDDAQRWQAAIEPILARQAAEMLGNAGAPAFGAAPSAASCARCGAPASGGGFCGACGAPLPHG